ncbi:hypothetical protein [Methylobacterium isbiliense]|jgi:hypothetical protein|uniref:Uncharacterized protein n=1 Tax=Methylobacterium isbiliense TaxID=315478 RepID=A0ABQ4SAD7_9HYPH|nr:hypothetical protein [Methylobacterium isbiliense]MDN3623367.1 hypothetical protein [Methylobacterium isbiliense]GJE00077.1 hypothetical protein GMJLKIPL_1995 [Methylobacterium isbiliense]
MTAAVTRLPLSLAAAAGAVLVALPAAAGGYGCTTAECYRRVSTPPVYGTVSEQVMVRPPRTVTHVVPPVYDTVAEKVLVSPGGRVWQTSYDAYGQLVGCWVTTPPRYAVRHRRVLVRPAEVVPQVIPPAYASFQRRVLVEPARSAWVPAGGTGYGGGGYGGPAPYGGPGYPGTYGPAGGVVGAGLGLAGAGVGLGVATAGAAAGFALGGGSPYDGY